MALATIRPQAPRPAERARKPASFEAKLAGLIAETAAPGWDDEDGQAIPAACWGVVRELAMMVQSRWPDLPEPHPSAGGDGSRHLRWSCGGNLFDIEITEDGRALWARRIGQKYDSGLAGSQAELLDRLEETFS
jgi:hypothetical protein